MVVAVLYQVELKRSSTTCLLLCRTSTAVLVHVGARKATAVHMSCMDGWMDGWMCVCVCVHRATCSTVDKVEKVEKVLLKQYGNTGGTRYTPPSYTLVNMNVACYGTCN